VLSNGALIEVTGYWHKRNGALRDTGLAQAWSAQVVFIDADDIAYDPLFVKDVLNQIIRAA
jgi:hypothetical protein